MDINTKFNLGDHVYYAESNYEGILTKYCDLCGGSGKLSLVVGGEVQCTECRGSKGVFKGVYLRKPHLNPSKIGRIQATKYDDNPRISYKDEISYMLYATGVGSGTLHKEDELFATKDECQKYCDSFNETVIKDFNKENNLE